MLKKLKYYYQKKHRYLDAYIQDLIAEKTNFKPYDIELLLVKKTNPKENVFNFFKFIYNGLTYELLDNDLKIVAE